MLHYNKLKSIELNLEYKWDDCVLILGRDSEIYDKLVMETPGFFIDIFDFYVKNISFLHLFRSNLQFLQKRGKK